MIYIWTIEVLANLRLYGIKQKDFAKQCGYSPQYLSQVLNGKKATEQSKRTILAQIDKIAQQHQEMQGRYYEQRDNRTQSSL